jgi:ParB-like chromosome segregation protein Spo0J
MDTLCVGILPRYGAPAKALVYLLNRHGDSSLVEECLLIRELVERDGLAQVDVAVMMERHKSWVSRRLEIVRRLNPQIVEDIKVGLLPPGSTRSLARLPECNQVDMGAAIQRDHLKVREVHRLVGLWCKAESPEQRRFIVESSRKALELANPDSHIDPGLVPSHLHAFFKTIGSLGRIARLLEHKSANRLGAMSPQTQTFLTQALAVTEGLCRDAIARAYSALSPKEAP